MTCIIIDVSERKNTCLPFVATLCVCYRHIGDLIEILCSKFEQCVSVNYVLMVDLVMSPKVTALLLYTVIYVHHGAYLWYIVKLLRWND